jgi:hypothetical protein
MAGERALPEASERYSCMIPIGFAEQSANDRPRGCTGPEEHDGPHLTSPKTDPSQDSNSAPGFCVQVPE